MILGALLGALQEKPRERRTALPLLGILHCTSEHSGVLIRINKQYVALLFVMLAASQSVPVGLSVDEHDCTHSEIIPVSILFDLSDDFRSTFSSQCSVFLQAPCHAAGRPIAGRPKNRVVASRPEEIGSVLPSLVLKPWFATWLKQHRWRTDSEVLQQCWIVMRVLDSDG